MVAALEPDLGRQAVVTTVKILAFPARQAAAHIVALKADQAVQFVLQARRLA